MITNKPVVTSGFDAFRLDTHRVTGVEYEYFQ